MNSLAPIEMTSGQIAYAAGGPFTSPTAAIAWNEINIPPENNVKPRNNPARVSMRPCPYGWFESAGLAASVRASRMVPEARTSAADSKPSARTDVECARCPVTIFSTAKLALTSIPISAIRCPVCISSQCRTGQTGEFPPGT